jgi:hypothetical protein
MNKWLLCVLIVAGALALSGGAWAQNLTCGSVGSVAGPGLTG